jgi:hypothetical protein
LVLAVGVVYSALGPHHHYRSAPPSFVFFISLFIVMPDGAVVTMSFYRQCEIRLQAGLTNDEASPGTL